MGVNAEIVVLSRRNSNVRSLALSLGQKRMLTAGCEETLRALQDASGEPRVWWHALARSSLTPNPVPLDVSAVVVVCCAPGNHEAAEHAIRHSWALLRRSSPRTLATLTRPTAVQLRPGLEGNKAGQRLERAPRNGLRSRHLLFHAGHRRIVSFSDVRRLQHLNLAHRGNSRGRQRLDAPCVSSGS